MLGGGIYVFHRLVAFVVDVKVGEMGLETEFENRIIRERQHTDCTYLLRTSRSHNEESSRATTDSRKWTSACIAVGLGYMKRQTSVQMLQKLISITETSGKWRTSDLHYA